MSEYALSRTRSAVIRSSSVDPRPTVLLTRTYSVPDVTSYYRSSDRYKPNYPAYYNYYRSYYPYRYYRDYSLYDDYWYDRYYYFSPLYSSSYPRRYSYSDSLPNPYYWSSSNYWTRYKRYTYGYGYPYCYRRYADPYYESYLSPTYRPYRSYLLDSMNQTLLNGLELYRKGVISFNILDNNWLKSDWDKRFKDYRNLYYWHDQSCYIPSYYNRRARQYHTEWAQ